MADVLMREEVLCREGLFRDAVMAKQAAHWTPSSKQPIAHAKA